jgi:GNAT superfamily N-acetyltransferase
MTLSSDQVLSASAAWNSPWFPPRSVHLDLGWLEYYVLDGIATVMRVRPGDMMAAELVPKVLTELWRQQATAAHWTVGPRYSPADVGRVLLDMGASVGRTVDICGCPLGRVLLDVALAEGATARPVRTRDDVAEFERTSALAWEIPPPSKDDIDRTFASLTQGYFIGCWKSTPAGAGGYGLAGEVARFWGTAVIPEFRGRGVYRALVHARMTEAKSRGATFALVHAMEHTSSPILQRLGFAVYGQQQVLAIGSDVADGTR